MSVHPLNDRLKVRLDKDEFHLESDRGGAETGIVVEVPEAVAYFGFHSFAFESSLINKDTSTEIVDLYKSLLDKRVYWEKLQDSGRHLIEEDGTEYVFLQMTDVLAYSDDVNDKSKIVSSTSAAGSFNLE